MRHIKRLRDWVLESNALLAKRFSEEMDKLRGGGPPNPMHPSPAGDDALLRKRAKKIEP
jgi:hypothetical protein